MNKLFIQTICMFIPVRSWRRKIRGKIGNPRNRLSKLEDKLNLIVAAVSDDKGMGRLNLLMEHAHVEKKYHFIFQKMRSGDVCVDCGVNVGIATDIMRFMGGLVYGFEPHPDLFKFLSQKYQNDEKVILQNSAVWDKNDTLDFQISSIENENVVALSASSSLFSNITFKNNFKSVRVPVIDLTELIELEILKKHNEIYLLKIDIEGAEFDLIEKIISTGLYRKIKYIVCETHERNFENGLEKITRLHSLIKENKIENIFLDWI
jgi:FkbM family methyltransferase